MVWKTQANFILISINLIALTHFEYPSSPWALPLFLLLTQINFIDDIKRKMQIVSLFSLISSFVVLPWVTDFFTACALGLAMNVGYRIDSLNAPWVINSSIGFGVILGSMSSSHLIKYQTGRDMAILICTLPNLFMAQDSIQKKQKSTLWFFNPFYDRKWTYSIGFIGGVFLPLSSISKHLRFLIISMILLMTIFVEGTIYEQILTLTRGFFIYDQSRHKSQLFFLMGYILIDILIPTYKYNYLFIGYLVIAVILWHNEKDYKQRDRRGRGQGQLFKELKEIQVQSD